MDIYQVIENIRVKYKLTDVEVSELWNAIYNYVDEIELQHQIAEAEYS